MRDDTKQLGSREGGTLNAKVAHVLFLLNNGELWKDLKWVTT